MIFTYDLPEDFSEDELRRWLEGFGQIEEVFLLRDVVARMSMVTKTCQCPGRMLRFRSMFQEKLGEFGHVGVTWLILVFQDFLLFIFCSKDRRLNAKGYVRFSSHRHAATCIQAQAFGPLSLPFILGLEVLAFKV